MPKTSSIRPVVSIQHWLVTDGQTDGRTEGLMMTAYTALAQRRVEKHKYNKEQNRAHINVGAKDGQTEDGRTPDRCFMMPAVNGYNEQTDDQNIRSVKSARDP